MISKLSSHLGPASIFSGGVASSLILYLDAGNTLSYPPSGFTVSGGGTQHILNNWPYQPSEWNSYGPSFLQGGDFQDLSTPLVGWYIVDDNGDTFQVLSGPASGYPFGDTPVYNGQGWFIKMSGAFSISSSNSTVTFYETQPTVTPIYGGSTWFDLTSYNNDINLIGVTFSPTYSNLINFTGAFEFDGSNSYGPIISGTAIPIGDSHYTIESWIQSDVLDSNGGIVGWGQYGYLNDNKVNAFRLSNTDLLNYWWGNDISGTPATFSTNFFYHVAATYDGTNRTLYFNGETLNSDIPGTPHIVPYFDNLTVGLADLDISDFFNGRISQLKIWNKSLNSSQILNSFNSNKSKFGYDFGSMTFNYAVSSLLSSTSVDYAFGTNDFTIEAYFKLDSSPYFSYGGIISLRGNMGHTDGVNINLQSLNTSTPLLEFSVGGGFTTYTIELNKWYHTAISRVGGTSSIYVNGSLVSEVVDSVNYGSDHLVIGRYYIDLDTHYINGSISNVRVINGTGLYSGPTLTIPATPLGVTGSNTKLLINSQENNSTNDVSVFNQTIINTNVGWTSSLPDINEFYYPNFSSTDGLQLVSTFNIIDNQIYLTDTSGADVGNVYSSTSIKYNRNFTFEWNFECSGGDGADGFCVQWTTTNNTLGSEGGACGIIHDYSTINAFQFQTFTNDRINWVKNDTYQSYSPVSHSYFRQNVFYWIDYNHDTSTINIYHSTSNTKPVSPQHTFNSVTFDTGNYYIGIGAACGGSVDNHILKSMKLTFN